MNQCLYWGTFLQAGTFLPNESHRLHIVRSDAGEGKQVLCIIQISPQLKTFPIIITIFLSTISVHEAEFLCQIRPSFPSSEVWNIHLFSAEANQNREPERKAYLQEQLSTHEKRRWLPVQNPRICSSHPVLQIPKALFSSLISEPSKYLSKWWLALVVERMSSDATNVEGRRLRLETHGYWPRKVLMLILLFGTLNIIVYIFTAIYKALYYI